MTDWLVRDRQAVRAALRPLDPRPEIGEGWRGVYGPGETVPTFEAIGDDPLVYLRWELQVLQEAGTFGATAPMRRLEAVLVVYTEDGANGSDALALAVLTASPKNPEAPPGALDLLATVEDPHFTLSPDTARIELGFELEGELRKTVLTVLLWSTG